MRQLPGRVVAAALAAVLALAALGTAAADGIRHTVAEGETLSYVAGLYGVTVQLLAEANDIANPNLIFVGQVLHIGGGDAGGSDPAPGGGSTYEVRPGDTLSAISQQSGVSVEALQEANGLADSNFIVVGQQLIIPSPVPVSVIDVLPAVRPSDPDLEAVIEEISAAEGVDPNLVKALAWVESSWRRDAVSPVGAVGVMQVMPDTAVWLERDVFGYPLNENTSVYDNVKAGVKLLRILLAATGDHAELAVASYYQGQGAMDSGVMYDDTRAYVATVLLVKSRFWP